MNIPYYNLADYERARDAPPFVCLTPSQMRDAELVRAFGPDVRVVEVSLIPGAVNRK